MLRFPSPEDRGEGVITEVLGPRGQPGVDTLSIIRALGLPDAFPEDVLEEAREAAAAFDENDLTAASDFTGEMIVTIDPVDARDFDDAVSLTHRPEEQALAARRPHRRRGPLRAAGQRPRPRGPQRGTSVYLPQRVIPMFPEIISNGLASLQQGKVRYVKSALIDFTADRPAHRRHASPTAPSRCASRFTYEQVSPLLGDPAKPSRAECDEPAVGQSTPEVRPSPAVPRCATWP